ncbi:MAG: SWIM zinc finger family protein [Shewanella putrefaciens]|nr:SWIM zinc finger family protein [Shewanella putrefaciens]
MVLFCIGRSCPEYDTGRIICEHILALNLFRCGLPRLILIRIFLLIAGIRSRYRCACSNNEKANQLE